MSKLTLVDADPPRPLSPREERDRMENERIMAARAALQAAFAERLEAIKAAERAARIMIAALHDALAHDTEMVDALKILGGSRPLPLNEGAFEKRISGSLITALSSAGPSRHRFGHLILPSIPNSHVLDNWGERDVASCAGAVAAIINPETEQ